MNITKGKLDFMLIYLQMIDEPHDRHKFIKVYETYVKLMFYVANEILHNSHDAEDAVQQAFISIAKNMKKISEVECPKTKGYVVTVVERKAIDILRIKARRREVELSEDIHGLSVEYTGKNEVTACILKLPARYKEVILLKYVQGYSTKEIARMLKLTESNAGKLLQRAQNKLEELCREEGLL